MGVQNINTLRLQGVLNTVFADKLYDLIPQANPVLARMTKKAMQGEKLAWRLKTSRNHAPQFIADGSPVATPSGIGSNYGQASLDWTTAIAHFSVDARTLAQAQGQPGELGALFESQITDAATDLANMLASSLFQPQASALAVSSVFDAINAGNSYAGVNRALPANAGFNSVVLNHSGAPISIAMFEDLDRLFFDRHRMGLFDVGSNYSIVTSNNIFNRYRKLFTSIDVSSLSTAHWLNQGGLPGQTNSLGGTTYAYNGIPLLRTAEIQPVAGDAANTSRIFFLDMNQIDMAFLNAEKYAKSAMTTDITTAPRIDGVPTEIVIKAIDGERIQGYLRTYVQTCVKDPSKAGALITNVSTL